MTLESDLWDQVKADYDTPGLIALTNVRDTSATAPDDTAGISAAGASIALLQTTAQQDYDPSIPIHLEAAAQGTIAVLWNRGGSSTTIARVRWDAVFAESGLAGKLATTGPRGAIKPTRAVHPGNLDVSGRERMGWADRRNLPQGLYPSDRYPFE